MDMDMDMQNISAKDVARLAEEGGVGEVRAGDAKRGKGGKGRAGGAQNREMLISKALSKLLRHAAESEGVELDGEGFARLDLVMQWHRLKSLKPTFADIRTAVTDNAKQRFSMKPNPSLPEPPSPSSENPADWMIRANQVAELEEGLRNRKAPMGKGGRGGGGRGGRGGGRGRGREGRGGRGGGRGGKNSDGNTEITTEETKPVEET
ncbi:RNA 2 -phosphotransferase [Botrytis cinerea]